MKSLVSDREINDDAYVKRLFSEMGPTYSWMNLLSSFGFSEIWRRACVKEVSIQKGDVICDMMSGSGECLKYVRSKASKIVSVDFCEYMIDRQQRHLKNSNNRLEIRRENACKTTVPDGEIDKLICVFGVKTLSPEAVNQFAEEIFRILKPGGAFALIEISKPKRFFLKGLFNWYISHVVPVFGKVFLGGIECYKMLGIYTSDFGSCDKILPTFEKTGLSCVNKEYFFGCATGIVGNKPK